jgi:glutamate racemase
VKPAAEHTDTGVVGVLATPTTFEGELYSSVVERFGGSVTILQDACPGLVAEIEAGRGNSPEAKRILKNTLEPMLAKGLDTVVLGCTHYPFAFNTIREIVGDSVRLIDPAPAIARRVDQLLNELETKNPRSSDGQTHYLTSGDPREMSLRLVELLNVKAKVGKVNWVGESLQLSGT